MTRSFRPLLLAVLLCVTAGAAAAGAQTVFLKSAPEGATVDVAVNGKPAGSGTVGADGTAQVPFDLKAATGKGEMDANVFLDLCGQKYRIDVVDRSHAAPAPDSACERRDIPGLFWVRGINTLVIDVAGTNAAMLLIRGTYTPPRPETPEGEKTKPKLLAPKGFVVDAGAGRSYFRDIPLVFCGNVQNCTINTAQLHYTFGAEYWFSRYIAASGSFIKPALVKANGTGDTYHFTSSLDAHVFLIEGKAGVAMNRVRLYGHGGLNFHQATFTTNETMDPVTLTLDDGSTVTIPGGSQTLTQKTQGWSWVYGGGGEVWILTKLAVFGEFGISRLKGDATDGSGVRMDDHFSWTVVGAKFRLNK